MPHYALADHVFVCLQGEHVVFLDVHNDRYFALEAHQTSGLAKVVPGWPVAAAARAEATDGASDLVESSVLALLLERGLLSPDVRAGKAATPVSVQPVTGELSADQYEGSARADAATLVRFIACAVRASLMLRFRGFERVVRRVSRRNEKHGGSVDQARLHRLVAQFSVLRPFFFTAKDMCLFEAFALSEFLVREGVFPRWVFGVQARPFAAHCWLQHGGIVLNDTADHVGRYTPIMIV
jgi:hypothetical protein